MEDFELTLFDRLEVIRTTIQEYGECTFYLSFSGGKDSTVLHYLLDMALPGNRIPRVYINTGIEYVKMVQFVRSLAEKDDRIEIINSGINIKKMLEEKGYPFKSKEHSKKISMIQKGSNCKWAKTYIDSPENSRYACPKILRYQLLPNFPLKLSDQCCYELKKKPIHKWERQCGKKCAITGIRTSEGGQRANHSGCVVFNKKGNLKSFKPLNPISDAFEDWFIEKYKIQLCELYYPPYSFKRTGCKGCPYSLDLQKQLETMERYLPNEKKQCEAIWKPVYAEYRRIGYRLKRNEQIKLF